MISIIIGGLIGGGLGFVVGKYFSRTQYGCPILCNPKVSTFYFAIIGILFATGR